MNIATIGTSWITDSFIKSSAYVGDVNISAVFSRDGERAAAFARKHGVEKHYSDLSEMLSDKETDGVYIASPNALHFEQAEMCLECGKHVICEKPMTVNSEQLEALYSIAERRGLILLEAMKSMHSQGLNIIRENLSDLGEVHTASFDFSQLSSKYPMLKRGELPNIFNPSLCAGALMDIGVYAVYLAVELFGKPKNIISHSDFLGTGADYAGTLIFLYDNLTVTITYSKIANGFSGGRILGENGAVSVKSVSKLVGINRLYNDGSIKELYPEIDENIIMSGEIKAFRDFAAGLNSEYYDCCKQMAFTVCELMEKIRQDNNFAF
ncbi:MAG: Gfo/Idh/MocA family oxidoreductase [Clostridiales bacterium]|nr:Gfo/Idh/MocA family oxidoreductase [Clostridiales bacterium]